MTKKAKRILKSFYIKNMKFNSSEEDTKYNKIIEILDTFANMRNMTKNEFLERVFIGAFKLIPEAEKGSFYELSHDKYIPIFASGYDIKTLEKLTFNKNDVFIGFECPEVTSINTYQTYVEKRDDTKFTKEVVEIFKELGTYSDFTTSYAPIRVESENVGLICLEAFNKTGFSQNSMKVLNFYVKIISDFYAQLIFHERQTKMYDEIVSALVSAIEVNDKYTEGHAQRVRQYSCAIANELKLSRTQIRNISTAALLHDVGKIGISSEILNKPGKLTEEEYSTLKLHAMYTKNILDNISDFSEIANFAYNHHEYYDGTGYPQGLSGNDIPIESQIIQVADAFDAMTSERAYRKALSKNEAIEIIRREKGKQFNPEIVEIANKVFFK